MTRQTLAFAVILPTACSDPTPPPEASQTPDTLGTDPPWFEEVAGSSGIDFTWHSGHRSAYKMPEIIGGGAAVLDYDGDGDLDVYLVQGGVLDLAWADPATNTATNAMYRNDGNWTFTNVTDLVGAADRGFGMGVAVGDIDGDADPDLYVTNMGRNALYRNDDGIFTDITAQSGTGEEAWSASAAFVDIDLDGDLDLFVTNYLDWTPTTELSCFHNLGGEDYCSPRNYLKPTLDTLYRNRGDGTFEDVTEIAGINAANGTGLGVVAADWTGDGYPDIFVANDGMPDLLWRNRGDGTFDEVGIAAGCALDDEGVAKAGMGVDTTDIDDDGDLDLIVCNLAGESDSLFRNEGGYFTDITTRTGLRTSTRGDTRFGLGLIDFDNDGWLDLYEANGAVYRESAPATADPYAQPDMLARGGPDGRFSVVSPRGGTKDDIIHTSRGAAFGDLDLDGRVDVVVVNRDASTTIYRNIVENSGGWVMLDVRDARGRPAIGAVISGRLGQRAITRPVHRAGSYLSSSDHRVSVGLGAHAALKDVRVYWPGGGTTRHGDLAQGQIHLLQAPPPGG